MLSGRDYLLPNFVLNFSRFPKLRTDRFGIWNFLVHGKARTYVTTEVFAQLWLCFRRKQIQAKIRGADAVCLFRDEFSPRIKASAGSRESEGQ